MKRTRKNILVHAALAAALILLCIGQARAEKVYYGVEINGVVCGYAEIETSPIEVEGKELILLKHRVFAMLTALGMAVNTDVDLTYHIDPETGQFTYHDSHLKQGELELDSSVHVEDGKARFNSSMSADETVVEFTPDTVRPNTLFYPHLKRDFVDGDAEEKSYQILEVREFAVQESTYTRVGRENVELAGKTFDTIVLDMLNNSTGLKAKVWLDVESGWVVKSELPGGRAGFLADASIVKKIKAANIDSNILSKVNVPIADYPGITYMKVKASVEPSGLWVTPESLNVPGQKFTGSVEENLVEGVFELEYARYDGSDAPPFPTDYSGEESLAEYLEAGDYVQSDDEVLIAKARELTAGSKDSWEAAVRISTWVAENIDYAIPGGGTARKTYDLKAGECGAHSFLTASFCRAVGIPARVVWGCMYVPNMGGAFGQHAWNEIYMGKEAGWIPIDSTAYETDFLDSGHIRLGEYQSPVTALNPGKMEILDYRVGTAEEAAEAESKYADFLGDYSSAESGTEVHVVVQDGSLTVDIPNKVMLALNEPDDEGKWVSKIADKLYCTFGKDDAGAVNELKIHELVRMQRKSSPEEIAEDVPDELKPLLGVYLLPQLQADFKVIYHEGSLAVDDPLNKVIVKLKPYDDTGVWIDEYDKNTMHFAREGDEVTTLIIDSASTFKR
jgi:transglutaminase-like putative cysteine protease